MIYLVRWANVVFKYVMKFKLRFAHSSLLLKNYLKRQEILGGIPSLMSITKSFKIEI